MSAHEDRAPVETIYNAAHTADLNVIAAALADEIVLYEPTHHPAVRADSEQRAEPGVWRGREDAMAGIAKVFSALRLTGVEMHGIIADGSGTVVGLLDIKGTDTNGNAYTMPMAEVFQVSGGKVTEIRAYYFDTVQLGQLLLT